MYVTNQINLLKQINELCTITLILVKLNCLF